MKTTITVTLAFAGIHNWPDCDLPNVGYLAHPHRHVFHITCELPVFHDNRDREFITVKGQILDYLTAKYPEGNFGAMSCEMIASDLVYVFGLCKCSVFEDGENGATVYAAEEAPKAVVSPTDTYQDPSSHVRSHWCGLEVEGRLKGVNTLFLATLAGVKLSEEPHVFLCPTVAQDEDPEQLESVVYALVKAGKLVTVAVKPKDAHKLRPFVRVNAHIMVDIDLHELPWLKPTDTIKVELAAYTTLASSVEQMVATHPQDYTSDTHIK